MSQLFRIVSIGDELLSGAVVDSNSAFINQQLTILGYESAGVSVVGDDKLWIARALRQAASGVDLLLVTGGLGPTGDDLTRDALALALEDTLVFDQSLYDQIADRFKQMNRPITPSNRVQAMRPLSATGLANQWGTAPGLQAKLGTTQIIVLPGVPREMREMFTHVVLPLLELSDSSRQNSEWLYEEMHLSGVGESVVGETLAERMLPGADVLVGTRVHDGLVTTCWRTKRENGGAERLIAGRHWLENCFPGSLLAGEDCSLVQAVVRRLQAANQTLSTAESCTGGMLSSMLVDLPGVSSCYKGSVIAYDNRVKTNVLDIPETILNKYGAVSRECVSLMSRNVQKLLDTDWALATSGIAGPDGGTAEKPVGLVWISLADRDKTWSTSHRFVWDRQSIRERATWFALDMLRRALDGNLITDNANGQNS